MAQQSEALREELEREVERLRRRVAELEACPAAGPSAPSTDEWASREEASFRSSIIARVAEGLCVCHGVEEFPYVRFTVWNDRMTEITGYTIDEINEKGWYQTVYPDSETSARAQARMGRMRQGEDLIAEEWEITRADGEGRVIAISTSVLITEDGRGHVLALMQDVTSRRRATDELARSREEYRTLYHRTPVMLHSIDRDGTLINVSDYWLEVMGYQRQDVIGRASTEFLTPESRARAEREVLPEFFRSGQLRDIPYQFVKRNGEVLDALLSANAVRNEGGDVVHSLAVVVDVTPLKRAEQERLQLEEQMQHAQKLESLGVLAGGIAHDFNNLLCGILGSADLALYDLEPSHPARADLDMLKETAQRATELCRQMLAYSGKGRFLIEPVSLSRLTEQMRHLLDASIAKKAMLRVELDPALPAVEADVTQLRQIILNLVVNASEALGGGSGTITVATGSMHCDQQYLTSVYLDQNLTEGRYAFLEVTDTGCGMDEDTRKRIFDPFFTTKFAGRGLGLAATLGIVRGHRGAIKVYSEPGAGTTVKVLLPASNRLPVEKDRPPEHQRWQGSGLVLLIDDEATVRTVGSKMLARLGFGVLLAEDGEIGVQKFREHADEIAAVILDMTMPKLGGEEAFRELRRVRPNVRVILTSGYNEQEATNRFAGKGLAGFLQKPFQLATMRDRLRAALEED